MSVAGSRNNKTSNKAEAGGLTYSSSSTPSAAFSVFSFSTVICFSHIALNTGLLIAREKEGWPVKPAGEYAKRCVLIDKKSVELPPSWLSFQGGLPRESLPARKA